jgi:hypothetical protein
MIPAMYELIIFWSLVAFVAVVGAVLRDVLDDDPHREAHHEPPGSHPVDPFSLRGSSFH